MGKRHPRATATEARPTSFADALFSRTQQRVFSLVFGQPERTFSTSELISLAGSGSGAVQRELQRLLDSKLVVATTTGRQKRYQANAAAPIFHELRAIVDKTAGVPGRLRAALAPLAGRIHLALLYGSVAKHADTAASDIDVLLVSDELALENVFSALQAAEHDLGRSVSPTLYTSDEFRSRRRTRHPFLTKVLDGPHVILVGSEHAIPAAG
jgi:predicted nucleotidyltransferase